mmetsp:Transcript_125674/g.298327  ORF Transcript_125674/g.298327 Transcript_125674/m.298327 type:complete len:90 (-) Transcript_125674:983-1252(-)
MSRRRSEVNANGQWNAWSMLCGTSGDRLRSVHGIQISAPEPNSAAGALRGTVVGGGHAATGVASTCCASNSCAAADVGQKCIGPDSSQT